MVAENILGTLFAVGFGSLLFLAMLWTIIELAGRVYGTFRVFVREDLTSEQRIIYFLLIWFIPFGWLIYFLLGTEKTHQLFADVEFV